MGLGGEFAKGAGSIAVDSGSVGGGNFECHGDAAGTDAVDGILDVDGSGGAEGFAEAGFYAVDNDVNVFVALAVKIVDAEEVLKELLLGALEVQEVTGVMEDAEGIEFIKEYGGLIVEGIGHVEETLACGKTYNGGDCVFDNGMLKNGDVGM